MTRPLHLEFPNTLYHVTSRGDPHKAIFEDDDDRLRFLERRLELLILYTSLEFSFRYYYDSVRLRLCREPAMRD